MADLNPDLQLAVSVAGTEDDFLPVLSPWRCAKTIGRYLFAHPEIRLVLPNLTEMRQPLLHWTPRLGGNLHALLHAHEAHLQRFLEGASEQASLIHAHVSYPAGWIAMRLSEKFGIPYVITEHMGPFPFKTPRLLRAGKLTKWIKQPLEQAAAVIAVSPSLAARMVSFGLPRPHVVPNMVDERRFTMSPPPQTKEPVFLTIASMVAQKGVLDLLHAIRLLRARGIHSRHIIAGSGPEYHKYRVLAERLELQEDIEWTGQVHRDDISGLFQHCHAFVLPSHYETFGIVYVEALASGRPVIATRCGGPEYFVHEQNGILVPVRSPEALAEAMQKLMEHLDRYDGEAIRQDCMARFSRKVVTDRLREIYEDAVA